MDSEVIRLTTTAIEVKKAILSFLPTKSLVATSLLSRKWHYLWSSTPNLELDEFTFDDRDQFINFAERALVLRDGSSFASFSLSCSVTNDCASHINTWITSAIRCNVKQLFLSLDLIRSAIEESTFLFPCSIFRCQSLVKLSLHMYFITIRVPSVVCLPLLKHLKLRGITFVDNESTEKLLSHPLLEELIILNCSWGKFITSVNVNSPNLRILAIDDLDRNDSPEEHRQVCNFLGDNLKIFRYKGPLPFQYCICGSTMQLSEAQLLAGIIDSKPNDVDIKYKRYYKLVNSLSRVQNLTLSGHAVMSFSQHVLGSSPELTIPVFEHVTRLNLTSDGMICIDHEQFMMIYKRCPHLEHLNFMRALNWCLREYSSPVLSPMPSCFRTHLKKITVHIYGLNDFHGQDAAIDILLCSASVLEEMVLYWHFEDYFILSTSDHSSRVEELERELNTSFVELEDELNTRHKVSENCRVSIVVLV